MYEVLSLQPHLRVNAYVSLWDFYEIHESLSAMSNLDGSTKVEFVSYRYSDKSVHVVTAEPNDEFSWASCVSIRLLSVFDYDIISFAHILRHNSNDWISCVGDTTKYNAGGSVRDVTSIDGGAVTYSLLGPGKYLFISSRSINLLYDDTTMLCTMSASSQSLGNDMDNGVLVIPGVVTEVMITLREAVVDNQLILLTIVL